MAELWDVYLGQWWIITLRLMSLSFQKFQPWSCLFWAQFSSLPTHLTPGGTMSHFLSIKLVGKLPFCKSLKLRGVMRKTGYKGVAWKASRRERRVPLHLHWRVRFWTLPTIDSVGDNYCHHSNDLNCALFNTWFSSRILILLFTFPLLICNFKEWRVK